MSPSPILFAQYWCLYSDSCIKPQYVHLLNIAWGSGFLNQTTRDAWAKWFIMLLPNCSHTHTLLNVMDMIFKAWIYLYKQQTMFELYMLLPYQYTVVCINHRAFLQGINGTELALVICTDTEVMIHPWPPHASPVKDAPPFAHPPVSLYISKCPYCENDIFSLCKWWVKLGPKDIGITLA